jgi:hypothetical protein
VPLVPKTRALGGKKFRQRNSGCDLELMLEQLQTYQQILFDLTANYLEPLRSCYARLSYLSASRNASSGKYIHEGLARVYGPDAVDHTMAKCHEEVFERLLEMPLNVQGQELRSYLSSLPGTLEENALICRERGKAWVPPEAPGYLKELYCSNLSVLLELLRDGTSRVRPGN